jgi:uncharacterized membrane protein YciS (DUF1049 family)
VLRLIKFLILLPVGVVLVLFGVANRQSVTLLLDPVSTPADALKVSVPLFVFFFATLMVGVVLGSITTWLAQGRYRKAGRQARRERDNLKAENTRLKSEAPAAVAALLPEAR